jgi:hypothetical protein
MDQVLERAYFLKCYVGDVPVHSKGLLQHLAHLEELFKRLHEVNMKIHPKKCEFVVTLVVYLGQKILLNGIMAHWAKVVAILEMPNLTHSQLLKGPKCGPNKENSGRRKSRDTLPSSRHFEG